MEQDNLKDQDNHFIFAWNNGEFYIQMVAIITNKDLVKALVDGARLNIQDTPKEIASKVVPILDGTPDFHRIQDIRHLTKTTSGDGTIFTASTSRDTYLVGYQLSAIKDATADDGAGAIASIVTTINGVTRLISSIAGLSLTAGSGQANNDFKFPMKIDRGATVILSGATFTVGNKQRNAVIYFYEVDIN